jgi:hypothetical protein
MAGSFARSQIAFIQLANSKGDIFATGSNRLVHNIVLHNINTTAEVVEINFHDGTNEYMILNYSLAADETYILQFANEGFYIPSAGKLTGNTTTAVKVTCSISGSIET